MQKEPTKRELRQLASQLRCPRGQMGLDIAYVMNSSNISMIVEGIAALSLSPNNTILELGHGNCKHLPKLLEIHESLNYFGLEISRLMVEESQKTNATYVQQERAVFQWYDGVHIPYPDQQFDKILTVNTIYFWQDPVAFLRELYRVLKPGGKTVVVFAVKEFLYDLSFPKYGFTMYHRADFKKLIGQTHFKILRIKRKKEFIKKPTREVYSAYLSGHHTHKKPVCRMLQKNSESKTRTSV